ncbi:hypothetical protein EYC80_002402 [Monilinia laxa]|uniref:CFEM domain-containing protein n=1 Tax=Monilinia laxa TaxID=61186 RepID=A0A5N6K3V3_MONLA|nr:hypothetical protein EYC80_002402 [Monilinia laxa]
MSKVIVPRHRRVPLESYFGMTSLSITEIQKSNLSVYQQSFLLPITRFKAILIQRPDRMQFTAFGLLALASLAIAQDSSIPACAQPCIADAVKSSTTCGASDTVCQCQADNVSKIQTAATSCVIDKCGLTVALTVQSAATAACAALPASSSTTPTSASSVASSSAVEPSSSAVVPSSSAVAPSSSAVESSVVSSPVSSPVSTPASTPVSSHASTPVSSVVITSGVASPTGSAGSNTTKPTASATSTVPYTGSGNQVKAGLGSALVVGKEGCNDEMEMEISLMRMTARSLELIIDPCYCNGLPIN